ncbi:hypothetical protein DPMN_163869 [Dreissena polymorpha]|uniref:Uncharacterized protein n=1 Tax=Dreissena polymorpha TaxID=45954 RepID=A0A9D4EXH3_DREPO|nr:hypothetical protein DPMN_163869 [Dreissena polymorpha]
MFMWDKYLCHDPDVFVGYLLYVDNVEQPKDTLVFKGPYRAFCGRVEHPGLAAIQYN